jgi:hypothetical protein
MIADIKAGHSGVTETSEVFESEQISIKFFRLVEIIHRDRPVRHSFDFEQCHEPSLLCGQLQTVGLLILEYGKPTIFVKPANANLRYAPLPR